MEHRIDRAIEIQRLVDVVLNRLEALITFEVREIPGCAGYQVVNADDLPAIIQ
jgi:hypothetical protein